MGLRVVARRMLPQEDLPERWVAVHEHEEYDPMQGHEFDFELYDHRDTGTAVRINEIEGHQISGHHDFDGWGYQVFAEYGPRDEEKGEKELAICEDLEEAHDAALRYMEGYEAE